MKWILVALLAAGCGEATNTTDTGSKSQPIVGSWLSEGANVAPLLAAAPFNWMRITAQFDAGGTYTVVGTDTSNKDTTFTGTFSATPSSVGSIYDITVDQTTPATTVAEGIFQVDGAGMKYEVVQTQPTNGLTPPTAEAGFGSTIYNGQAIATLIQTFVRQ